MTIRYLFVELAFAISSYERRKMKEEKMYTRPVTPTEEKENQGDEKQHFRFFSPVWDERTRWWRENTKEQIQLCVYV